MQAWELTVPLGAAETVRSLGPRDIEEIFHREHERVLGVSEPGADVEILGLTARACVHAIGDAESAFAGGDDLRETGGWRRAYFKETGWTDVEVITDREIRARETVTGPAVVLENTTTIVVYPGQTIDVRDSGNYILQHRDDPSITVDSDTTNSRTIRSITVSL